ncbi:MAG: carboxypeptidase-like regulatory domain-containing protein [Candidatus Aminicenantales bacterium]
MIDQRGLPIQRAFLTLSSEEQNIEQSCWSHADGFFNLCGLPFSPYTLHVEAQGFKALTKTIVLIESSYALSLKLILESQENPGASQISLFEFGEHSSQTIIDKRQIQSLPSGNSLWSLIENQDLSATTNRIDVGGLWGSIPALFSSRGSCSWTQNSYSLNGLNVTDPFWTGRPLLIPDVFSLQSIQHSNASHPIQAFFPGAFLDLVPQDGSSTVHGGLSLFYTDQNISSSNITPALIKEGIQESHSLNDLKDGRLHFSGPLLRDKLFFFTSWTTSFISRDLADYAREDYSSLLSGLVNFKYIFLRHTLRFLWTGQSVSHPSADAGRNIPSASTSKQKNFLNVFQLIWDSKPREGGSFRAAISLAQSRLHSDFQDNAAGQHGEEIFRNLPSGPTPFAGQDSRRTLVAFFKGTRFFANFHKTHHLLQYGFQLQSSFSSSRIEILDNVHLHYFNGNPLEVVLFNTPLRQQESSFHLNLFFHDTMTLSGLFSVFFGLNLGFSQGWNPESALQTSVPGFSSEISREKNEILWLNGSPRFGLLVPLSRKKTSYLKISCARYYFTLPHNYLTYGSANALGGLVYEWQDSNQDGLYQAGEEKRLLRREGPFFAKIAGDLKRPFTDELAVSLVQTFGSGWCFTLAGFIRETKNLIETTNIGVSFSDYDPFSILDDGDDRIPGTADDLVLTVYNQKSETLGRDFFLLTNPDAETRISKYQGLDLTLTRKFSAQFGFFLSLSATHATGMTSPGNTEWENDDGVVGSLYDTPNTLINTEGRPRFDRAYTARIGVSLQALWGIRIGCVAKYYDGQPFARKIIVQGANQGPFYIQAHPRGIARYEFNMNVDIRLEKSFVLSKGTLRILLDGFNIFNQHQATAENEWTSPEFPLRFATEIQSPRVVRIGLTYEF